MHAKREKKKKHSEGHTRRYCDMFDSLRDSMSFPMCTVGQRFQGMVVKDNPVRLGIPTSDQNILDQFQLAVFIDSGLVHDKLTAKDLEKAK